MQHTATHSVVSAMTRSLASHCNPLQSTATHCNTMQHNVTHSMGGAMSRTLESDCNTLQHTATHCNTLQHTAAHCNSLQHTATLSSSGLPPCNTLQHPATHCNTLQQIAERLQRDIKFDASHDKEDFWGFITVLNDFDTLINASGLPQLALYVSCVCMDICTITRPYSRLVSHTYMSPVTYTYESCHIHR